MSRVEVDVAVVGAGPAGLAAAIEASEAGATVALLDDNAAPGGQIYRALPAAFARRDGGSASPRPDRGQALRRELESLPVRRYASTTVWGCFQPGVLEAEGPTGPFQVHARAVVVAAGAYDRPVPLPGWTLPGVLTVGGAQTLLKSQRLLPGRRFLFAGAGPLLLVVAAQYAEAGASIAAVADAVEARRALAHAPSLARSPRLAALGLSYHWSLRRRRVPWLAPRILVRVEGESEVRAAVLAEADGDWNPSPGTERTYDADTVCVGYGLVPSVEILRLLGCALRYDEAGAAWVPERDEDGRTTVPGVFAVGDGAGVAGAAVAEEEGRLAGVAAAESIGRLPADAASGRRRGPRARLARLAAFRRAMDALYRPRPGLYRRASADTMVCRCEEVPLREIEEALTDGARTAAQVKCWTRAGMGPCQGRMCHLPIAQVLAARTGLAMAQVGPFAVRPPVKPVAVESLIAAE